MVNDAAKRVWIVRKGNGALRVYPSDPIWVKPGEILLIRNLTRCPATFEFDPGTPVDPIRGDAPTDGPVPVTVGSDAPSGFFEYSVRVNCDDRREFAEAGSAPGLIIDG